MAVNDPTTHFGWLLPDTGGDIGAWGGLLNAIFGEDTGPPLGIDGVLKNIEDMFLSLNADNLTQGEVPNARLSGSYTGITNITASGTVTAAGSSLSNQLIVATNTVALSATNDNLNVGDATFIRMTPAAGGSTVTGVTGGVAGRLLWIANLGSADITFADDDTGSTASNRFRFVNNLDLTISANQVATFVYDGNNNRWMVA